MPKPLVIVESPAKARTIGAFLGSDYVVESSIGHIRDLPRSAGDIPPELKKQAWARLGVDVENGFRPLYVIDAEKKAHIGKLKNLLKDSSALFLATDEDREGESIAWHLLEVLKPKVPVKRMVFHEITKRAISEAIEHPRDVDRRLVDAQEARRILDRLYGYEVSPVLWKKVMPKLSAGRVQSVATRIIVERERARIAFRVATYCDIEGLFAKRDDATAELSTTLSQVDGQRVASGKDFGDDGLLKKGAVCLTEEQATTLAQELAQASFVVSSVERKPNRRSPSPPFMTSTLQQEAGRKLRFSSARTMQAAQRLYENGYITYMRTDSTTLAVSAVESARKQIADMYGHDYVPKSPRVYTKKVKNAQEAHEAIRPAGDVFRLPEAVAREVGSDEARLYELVWKRTIASQMEDARGESVNVRITGKTASGKSAEFSVTGNTIVFPGFLRAYVEGSDDPGAELEQRERHLPPLVEGEPLLGKAFKPRVHETQPPARFTEASLVRRLEELGVGRPSTYASIISTIQDRGYVWKKGSALIPAFRAFAVVGLLEQHFAELVDYAFTARMEDELDSIARGSEYVVPWLTRFYFGGAAASGAAEARAAGTDSVPPESANGGKPRADLAAGLRSLVAEQLSVIDARAVNSLPVGKDAEGREIMVRVGRFGSYLQRGEQTASVPDDLPPDELTVEAAVELLNKPSGERELGADPGTGKPILLKHGRFGSYVQVGALEPASKDKPKTASLLQSMSPETLTLEDALRLLSLPREVGIDPADKQPISAQIGRYGPYISKGTDSRSLEREEQVFSVTLDEALVIFAKPRERRRAAAKEPLRVVGDDDVSNKPITLREGRFGLYVTDGETNASLRKGDDAESLTLERARELLQTRRDRGPVQKRGRKAAKKSAKPTTKASKPPAAVVAVAKKKAGGKKKAAKKTAKKSAKKAPKKDVSEASEL